MRIGLDGRYIRDHFPGVGRYVYNLACALADQAREDTLVVFVNAEQPNTRYPLAALAAKSNVTLVTVGAAPFTVREQLELPLAARRQRLNVLHSPYYLKPYALPVPSVTTLYDVTPGLFPEYLPSRRARFIFELTTRWAIETSAAILTLAESARADLVQHYDADPARVTVTYPGVPEGYYPRDETAIRAVRERLGLTAPYILYLGINKPHKNLVRLVDAFADVARRVPDIVLALAGRRDPRYPDAVDRAAALGLSARVRVLDDVPEPDLPALYSGAAVFAFPSVYEGFGFPVLEAMACGVPVVTSAASSLPEVAGDAAVLVAPDDTLAIANALTAILQDGRLWTHLHRAGLQQAGRFRWARTAADTLAVYRRVAR